MLVKCCACIPGINHQDVVTSYLHCLVLQEDSMPVDQFVYNAELARLCGPGARTHPDWIKALYVKHVGGNILRKPDSFRDTWDDVELETFALLDELCAEMLSDLRQLDGSSQAMS